MGRIFIFALLLQITVSMAQNVRIATYNVENLYDTINAPAVSDGEFTPTGSRKWNTAKYETKIEEVSRSIANVKADIMGLCEVENATTLRAVMPSGYRFVHYDSPDVRGIDVALIYDPTVLRVNSSEPIRVSPTYRTRHILRVDGVIGTTPVTLIVAHLPSRLGNSTTAAIQRYNVGKMIDSIAATAENVVVMGDFNQNPSPQLLKKLYNTTAQPFKDGKGSYAYRDVWQMYDQIFVSTPLRFSLIGDAVVHRPQELIEHKGRYRGYPKKGHPSDHLPVYIEMVLK